MAKKSATITKPPVVTIMGHVDHGKTTLLDHIRHTNLTASEAGGITQAIGAYQITHRDQPITFIDTPGHAAFSKMRARGAAVTDIVVLVVAADDGVMPQTKESIRHIKESGVPVIVAINKIDVKGAVPEMAKAQLVEEGINVEGYGGNTPVVEISAIKGTNIDKLLDTILALAEIEELTSDPNAPLEAVVIESQMRKNLGPVATLLVSQGTLKLRDELVSLQTPPVTGKARRLSDSAGRPVNQAGPSTPVEVLGLSDVPSAGSLFTTPDNLQHIQTTTNSQAVEADIPSSTPIAPAAFSEEETPASIQIILNADTRGSLEAIRQNLADEVQFIKTGTGPVTESDVLLAQTTDAVIIAFNVPVARSAKKLADIERVPIHSYTIIYKLLEDFEQQVLKLLEPTIDEQELGKAKVIQTFQMKGDIIAGCRVTSGALSLNDKLHLLRGKKIITDVRLTSLKQGKVDVNRVEAVTECGLITKPQIQFKPDDELIAFTKASS